MEIPKLYQSVPAYSALNPNMITEGKYRETVRLYGEHLSKALNLWERYEKEGLDILLTICLEELSKAHTHMTLLMLAANPKAEKALSTKATFLMDLAATVTGT